MDRFANILAPVAVLASFLYFTGLVFPARTVSADLQYPGLAKSGGSKMNSSLAATSGGTVPSALVGSRLRPTDLSASIADYSGLVGKKTLNTSHKNIPGAATNKSQVERVNISDVFTPGSSSGSKVLPSVVDPSSSFLQAELYVSHPNPILDIRGEPKGQKNESSVTMSIPIPPYGPWEPEDMSLRATNHFPLPTANAATSDFFG